MIAIEPFAVEGGGQHGRPKFKRYLAGYVHVPAETEHRRNYEVAAWYTDMETVEDRWYPVFASRQHTFPYEYELFTEVEAVVTRACTVSLFGGVAVGSTPQHENHKDVGTGDAFNFRVKPGMVESGQFIPLGTFAEKVRRNVALYALDRGEWLINEQWTWVASYDHIIEKMPVADEYEFSYSTLRLRKEALV